METCQSDSRFGAFKLSLTIAYEMSNFDDNFLEPYKNIGAPSYVISPFLLVSLYTVPRGGSQSCPLHQSHICDSKLQRSVSSHLLTSLAGCPIEVSIQCVHN